MNDKLIGTTKQILTEWNPLRNRSTEIKDLNDYETEAINILSHLNKEPAVDQVENVTRTVLEQAFGLHLTKTEVMQAATKIHDEIKKIKAQ